MGAWGLLRTLRASLTLTSSPLDIASCLAPQVSRALVSRLLRVRPRTAPGESTLFMVSLCKLDIPDMEERCGTELSDMSRIVTLLSASKIAIVCSLRPERSFLVSRNIK